MEILKDFFALIGLVFTIAAFIAFCLGLILKAYHEFEQEIINK